ncbi:hypothetical protein GGS24DRAFT_455706 [Hypoxylon argillaceum]|nr:hypothetical protein GGS24DRAFT_455706 [Hypoxylon argillaceum]
MDLYEVLNVPSNADVATIQRAFGELSQKFHKASASTIRSNWAETKAEREARERRNHQQFIRLHKARETLINPTSRQEYDEQRRCVKKESTNNASKSIEFSEPSKPSRAMKLGKGNTRHSAAHQEMVANLDVETNLAKRLGILHNALNRMLFISHGLAPRVQSIASSREYSLAIALFRRIIGTNKRMMDSIKDAIDLIRTRGLRTKATYEAATDEANPHIQLMRNAPRLRTFSNYS